MAREKTLGKDSPGNGPRGSRRYKRISSGRARWDLVDAESIRDLIAFASAAGGAIRFGTSRDGGAYSIGVYGDGDPYTEWVSSSDDVDEVLTGLTAVFEGLAAENEYPPF